MKIGIITIFKANNYGAELQAYALQNKLELMGYESELIDYPFYKHCSFKHTALAKPLFDIGVVNKIKETIFPLFKKFKNLPNRKSLAVRYSRMAEFHSKHTKMSAVCCDSVDKLFGNEWAYDAYVVGSDQVWNPRTACNIEPYFLTFAPEKSIKVSYASSFGVNTLQASQIEYYRSKLSAFTALSVRESSGVDLIKQFLDRDVKHVLDPTLLLHPENWNEVAHDPAFNESYVLLYDLIASDTASSLAREVSRKLGNIKVVSISDGCHGMRNGILHVGDAGPSEFLGLFKNTEFVVTSSFHGTAFSINYNKPFFSVQPTRMKNSGRIHSILNALGLLDRLVREDEGLSTEVSAKIDYNKVNSLLNQLRQDSENYLSNSLPFQKNV